MIPPRPEHSTQDELRRSWAKTISLLEKAKQLLSPARLESYGEFLSHNELELALDELAEAAEDESPSADFWQTLAAAADNMHLGNRAAELRARGNGAVKKE